MMSSDRHPGVQAPPARLADERPAHGTLPPPEWTSPTAGRAPSAAPAPPLQRRSGARADEAWLRARVEEARAANDPEALPMACAALARWLASRDRDLDEAVTLATSALSVAEDTELRRELSAWLESLGEAARAAAALKPIASSPEVESAEAVYVLVRTGALRARAGAAASAAAAFDAALSIERDNALPAELLGALSAWEPEVVPPAAAADAYVEAARRRAAAGQDDAELEDLWRALATDASSDAAVEALGDALDRRGRSAAADEVWRAHARALAGVDAERVAKAHAHRRAEALKRQEPARALAVSLDQGLDASFEGHEGEALDALLLDVGMLEVVAARLEVRAGHGLPISDRAALLVELARLCAGPLADDSRAVAAYAAALAADPACEEAVVGLRGVLGDSQRAIELGTRDARAEPLRALAASIERIGDERERYARLLESLAPAMPALRTGLRQLDDGSNSRAAASRAWVRASVSGDVRAQGVALERVAATAAAPLRAVLLSVAAQRYLSCQDTKAARQAAEQATQADPSSARSIATLADAVLGERDRVSAAALERAIATIGPRVAWCSALGDALDAIGELELAVAWSTRCVALRPGDAGVIETLFERLFRGGDAARLGDALAWLLSQPLPLTWLSGPFGRALGALAILDVDRAAVVARRALDVFGPKSATLREAMLEVAKRASDDAFAAAVLERWLSAGVEGADRRQLFTTLVELRQRLGDEEGETRTVARAVREGLSSPEIDAHLERIADRPATPDAQLWRMDALAARLGAGRDAVAAAWAWRDLGAARWDLADDRVGAVAAWLRAANAAPSGGHATLALDLVAFAGAPFAFEYLSRLIDGEPDDATAAAIAADAARAALSIGEARGAFDLAARGVARVPGAPDALEIAEKAAGPSAEHAALSALYELVAARALGRFGRRAAHYRGARFFERCSEHALALKHAAQAFYAVPSEGSSFQLLARAAERAGDRTQAVRTIEQVAERAVASEARAAWLLRAASIAGEGEDGARRRVDALLRAAVALPTVPTIALLRDAARDLLRFGPEERDVVEMRLGRAARAITERIEGPHGARVAIGFAIAFLDLFSDSESALSAVQRAFGCDADVDEFVELAPYVAALGQAERARERVAAMLDAVERAFANVGIPALSILAGIAKAAGDESLRARAAVAAAVRDPDDDALVVEADAAVRTTPELAERLAASVPTGRRAAALLAAARRYVGDQAYGEAAALFEKAIGLVDDDARPHVERELRRVWDAAGRGAEIEARVQREAVSDVAAPAMRADRWMEVAERREARSDRPGAVRALLEACTLDPKPLDRWSALERVAEAAGDDGARVQALEEIAKRVGPEGRAAVFKRLARTHQRRSDFEAAERTWQLVFALDPQDEETDLAMEATIVARGRYDELVDHLARRADRLTRESGMREMLRAVRLRRAAILEQRLGRIEEACDELGRLLVDSPDNPGALRYLADLLDRRGEPARSAPLWRRAAAVEADPNERDDLELKAGRASRAAGDLRAALEHANRVLVRRPTNAAAIELRVDLARALGADADLGDALEGLASGAGLDDRARSDLLLEAAQAAARAGDHSVALDRARRAAEAAPDRATPQLLARGLEYRLRGAGAPEDARRTVDELSRIKEALGADDAALRTFLMAEALDVAGGGGAGLQELQAARASIGDHPLIALGLAERLAAQGQQGAAVDSYRVALGGRLLDLRKPGSVALAAADAAIRASRAHEAAYFLDLAEHHEEVRSDARARRALLLERETAAARASSVALTGQDLRLEDLEAAVRGATMPGERALARLSLGRARLDHGDIRGAEPLLWEALADGLCAAGDVLASLLAKAPERARDLVRVRRQQVAIEPGDAPKLEWLRAAALADGDRVYARAVEHVLRAFDPGAGPLVAPPLAIQPDQTGIFALLTRPATDAAGEALALLWEGAMQLFLRDAASYAITGVERVVPGPTSPMARLYEVAMRLLDLPRIPLFVPRATPAPPSGYVALLSPPSVVLTGDVRDDTTEVRLALGRGISAALPPNVLRLGLPPSEGRAVIEALRAAFGPPEVGRGVDPRAARLAESFWQIIPARTQRRLQQLLGSASFVEYDELVARASQSGWRVGLFLAGDFAWAARGLLAEAAGQFEGTPTLATLKPLCERVPMLADLLRLAVSPEYADARWHAVASASRRGSPSSGRFSLF